MESKAYDVIIIPEMDLAKKAYSESEKLKIHGTMFTLKNGAYHPHISLYMLQLKVSDVAQVLNILSRKSVLYEQFELVACQYHQAVGYIDVEYKKTTILINLQNEVVAAINHVRDGLRSNDEKRLYTAIGNERSNIIKYGYKSVGEFFEPHITLARMVYRTNRYNGYA